MNSKVTYRLSTPKLQLKRFKKTDVWASVCQYELCDFHGGEELDEELVGVVDNIDQSSKNSLSLLSYQHEFCASMKAGGQGKIGW